MHGPAAILDRFAKSARRNTARTHREEGKFAEPSASASTEPAEASRTKLGDGRAFDPPPSSLSYLVALGARPEGRGGGAQGGGDGVPVVPGMPVHLLLHLLVHLLLHLLVHLLLDLLLRGARQLLLILLGRELLLLKAVFS